MPLRRRHPAGLGHRRLPFLASRVRSILSPPQRLGRMSRRSTKGRPMADLGPNTIAITGASSGIGKATARLFVDKGWNVVATMRNPAAEKDLKESARLKLVALDVQEPASPKAAVAEAIRAFGRIDVWLNNAGYGAFGPVEAGTPEQIRRQFDVNVFGLIACVQAVAPHFRANKARLLIHMHSVW